ncbi:MAG: hypothetical protein GC138_01005 [Gammaproteobacteria bacterium]|nr:hypothetical protein [Gammaproteobacteria bacterium]
MKPWELLDTAAVPGGNGELRLSRRNDEYSISLGHLELMNSRVHGSEEALAELACRRLKDRPAPRVLIGGLGMGFTLAAALKELGADAEIMVAELVPAVVVWNRERLAHLAGRPLDDSRVTVYEGDVGELIRASNGAFDAVLLDVDNGPEGFSRKENDSLYSSAGLGAIKAALRPKGIFGMWSISPDQPFSKRLKQSGLATEETVVRARAGKKGGRHTIWLATKVA